MQCVIIANSRSSSRLIGNRILTAKVNLEHHREKGGGCGRDVVDNYDVTERCRG